MTPHSRREKAAKRAVLKSVNSILESFGDGQIWNLDPPAWCLRVESLVSVVGKGALVEVGALPSSKKQSRSSKPMMTTAADFRSLIAAEKIKMPKQQVLVAPSATNRKIKRAEKYAWFFERWCVLHADPKAYKVFRQNPKPPEEVKRCLDMAARVKSNYALGIPMRFKEGAFKRNRVKLPLDLYQGV
jgi:hypothetical protein